LFVQKTYLQKTILFLKGLAMGTANKVPGVSGGAVAFVLGFYEELIYTFQKINGKALKLLLNGRFKTLVDYLNLPFLMLVMGGSLFSYFSVSIVLDYFLRAYELYVWSVFFGMIVGSVFYISKKYNAWTLQNIVVVLLGVAIGLALSLMPPAKENSNLWFVFLCGIIGVSGMTFPGLSGSFLLMLLGNYVLLLVDAVNVVFNVTTNVLVGNFEVLQDPVNRKYIQISLTFFMGSFVGLVSISHLLSYILKRWNHLVNALIIGFITGSLGMVWPWKEKIFVMHNGGVLLDSQNNPVLENYQRFIPELNAVSTWVSIGCIVLGTALVLGIDYYEHKRKTI
jgi:putative membrane protein